MRTIVAVVCLTLLVMLKPGFAQAADDLRVSGAGVGQAVSRQKDDGPAFKAEVGNGYARLLIRTERGENVDAMIESGILALKFERPKTADIDRLKAVLSDYIALARSDPGRRNYRFALTGNFTLQKSRDLRHIAVDLIAPGAEAPEKLKIVTDDQMNVEEEGRIFAKRTAPRDLGYVGVRVSELEDLTRISIDWPQPVDYSASLQDGITVFKFRANGDPDISRLRVNPPHFVETAEKAVTSEGLELRLKLSRKARLRHHREGSVIVIDLYEEQGSMLFSDADGVAGSVEHSIKGNADILSTADRLGTDVKLLREQSDDAVPGGVSGQARDATAAEAVPETPPEAAGSAGVAPEPTANKTDSAPVPQAGDGHEDPQASGGAHHVAGDETSQEADDHDPPAAVEGDHPVSRGGETDRQSAELPPSSATDQSGMTADAGSLPVSQAPETVSGGHSQSHVSVTSGAAPGDVLKVQGYDSGKTYTLIFPWGEPIPAAVFKRGKSLWIVFDARDKSIDLSALNSGYGRYIGQTQIDHVGGADVVRVALSKDFLIGVDYRSGSWTVALQDSGDRLPDQIDIKRSETEDGRAVVRAALDNYSKVHWIDDPRLGERLAVVTAVGPVRGIVSERKYVEFDVATSAQGMVIAPKSDDIYVRGDGQGIVIGSNAREGLIVTRQRANGRRYEFDISSNPGRMDLANWRNGPDDEFPDNERQIQLGAVMTPDMDAAPGLGRGRAAQARFYLAHGLAAEALGVLEVMRRENEDVEVDPSFLALRGVANYMARRYEDALRDLNYPRLEGDLDATLWRAATLRRLHRYGEAREAFEEADGRISDYPPAWQEEFHLAAADAALATKDLKSVKEHLDRVKAGTPTKQQRAEADLLQARLDDALGNTGSAADIYAGVVASGLDPYASQAEFDLVNLKLRLNQMTTQTAIDKLGRLQFAWRGDDLETQILHKLGELYIEQGDYREGLTILRDLLASARQSDFADDISQTLSDTFNDLFLQGKADTMPPIKAVGLYYEFRELTPIGRDGDDMIRRLAERLVSVDLLSQAEELLDHQVRHRLSGVARAQVAARLALIYLMDQKPSKALVILRSTRQTGLPAQLNQDRRLIEGRAMAELERYDHALELIDGYYELPFERLRADIYWGAQDWPSAGAKLRELVERTYDPQRPLSDIQRADLLRAGVAFALAEDGKSLAELRAVYGEKMAESTDAENFRVVTSSTDSQSVDFRRIASEIASVDTLNGFMAEMSRRFRLKGAEG